jgi:hypothetical protein
MNSILKNDLKNKLSMVDPKRSIDYVCTILDGGDTPKFQVVPQDDVDNPIVASSATGHQQYFYLTSCKQN